MHIKSVEFTGAIGQIGQAAPDAVRGLSQVAFSGRSNVGKSSLINRFLGRTRTPIARVSSTPGKTQEINFFRVRTDIGEFALADLPGYGFARAPAELRGRWAKLIDAYLGAGGGIHGVVQLIDIRHGPTADDERAIDYLAGIGIPVLFVLTKADKLRTQRRRAAVRSIGDSLGVDETQVIPVSALSGEGIEELREAIGALVFGGSATAGEVEGTAREGEADGSGGA